jgi:hypothetical protein
MNRYKNTNIKKTSTGKNVYQSIQYPNISEELSDNYIITEAGDRLDSLAFTYYEDVSYWVVIASINNLGKGTMIVPAGMQLRIIKNPDAFVNKII